MALDAKHEAFTAWAKEQGVVIGGVAPAKLPGKGFGIVATRKLKKGETIVTIPASTLITHDSTFVREAGLARGTVYGAVAAALTLNHTNEARPWKLWQATWPNRQDFETSMPLCWSSEEQVLLPPTARNLLDHQRVKYERDLESIRARLECGGLEDWERWYRYYWLVVNTRCFYWVYFRKARDLARRGKKLARDECLALVPWGDYFNHEDTGCEVMENEKGASVVCNRDYDKGEEVVVSYGAHSNDYLLVEYGFTLSRNKHDSAALDHTILPLLSSAQKELLEQYGYVGSYYLTATRVCYRTEVAVRAMVTSAKRMQEFLDGEYDGMKEERKLGKKLREVLELSRDEIEGGFEEAGEAEVSAYVRSVLLSRWRQMSVMLKEAQAVMVENGDVPA